MKQIKEINELFLITVVTGIAGSYVAAFLGINRASPFASVFFNQLVLALPTVLYVITSRIRIKDLFRFRKIKIGTIFLAILFTFAITPLMQVVNLVSMLFAKNEIAGKIDSITEGRPFILSLFVIAVVPAFLEESVYRGGFFNVYSRKSPLKAIVLSGLLFGLMHLNFNQFSYAFVMGMIFCFLVEGTNSIYTTMLVHFVINGTSVIMLYVEPFLQKWSAQSGKSMPVTQNINDLSKGVILAGILVYGMVACFTTVIAVLLYIAMAKHENRWEHIKMMFRESQKQQVNEQESFVSMPLLIGIIICIGFMIANELI
ncbi:CPBP family intramembrane glutamic endopeptidase [[Clostridium] polysaccharolyticum]|uniref:CAAX prenyl protease 2/Lysostaphin resistance protein A-like domain-containing protein n=1 Tax=[Clostridium] polysaccharolyticum TaxID=29364 RepID=A0A1I0FX79_9FIRM|nr:type II CAAX endopeptidase family protein [[Clostridium] polysaccharolyticum]SET62968.1 hypothetical protein SAMN04487772_14015 [[Clostridium] polysaccharolyticum]